MNITVSANAKSCSHCCIGRLQADEQKLRVRHERSNLLRSGYSIQVRQTDIDKNEIRLQSLRTADRINSVHRFTDDLQVGSTLQGPTHQFPERLKIFD